MEMASVPADELRRLYATIAQLREQMAERGISELGAADRVILREISDESKTRDHIAQACRMSAGYVHVRLSRLRAIGHVKVTGTLPRKGSGKPKWLYKAAFAKECDS